MFYAFCRFIHQVLQNQIVYLPNFHVYFVLFKSKNSYFTNKKKKKMASKFIVLILQVLDHYSLSIQCNRKGKHDGYFVLLP